MTVLTVIRLLLDVYDNRGVATVFKDVQLSFVPRKEELFQIGPGLVCSVEEVTGDISGYVAVRLRLRNVNVPDSTPLIARLLTDGWQAWTR